MMETIPEMAVNSDNQVMQQTYPFADAALVKYLLKHPKTEDERLWLAAASTLAYFGEAGRVAFSHLNSINFELSDCMFNQALEREEQGIGPITYKKLAEYGLDLLDSTELPSPARYIEWLWQEETLGQMGIQHDKEKKKTTFNPNIFVEYFQKQYKLVIYEGTLFFIYEGGVWRQLADYKIKRLIRDQIQSVRKNLYRSGMGDQVIDILRIAVPEMQEMNPRKDLINLQNGMLDINSFKLLPHDPNYFSTLQTRRIFDPEAKCERFEQFVAEIMEDDVERIQVIQEIIGYMLTAEMKIHKAYFFFGEGSNGKSLLADIITSLVGAENVSNISLKDLEKSFSRSEIVGKTVNISTENENSKGFNSQIFKMLVSGDRMLMERKHKDPFSYVPICKLLFALNRLPGTSDTTHGFFRRVCIVPFRRRFSGDQADKNLKQKLEKELPGILNWALTGLNRLRSQNYQYTYSAVIEEAIQQYSEQQTPLRSYMQDMLYQVAEGGRVSKAEVVETYYLWCRRNGISNCERMSSQAFWAEFASNCGELGIPYEVQKSSGQRYLKKLALHSLNESNHVNF